MHVLVLFICFNLIVFKGYRFLIAVAFKTNPSSVYHSSPSAVSVLSLWEKQQTFIA